jgi:formylglycine-generating enzyme required for sulfatase activity
MLGPLEVSTMLARSLVLIAFFGTTALADDGAPTVKVPAGKFQMGCDPKDTDACGDHTEMNQGPLHTVTVSAFEIDKYETSQTLYAACVKAGACTRPSQGFNPGQYGEQPVSWVTWKQADAYCKWAGKRLPTEAEWEKAARGTDGRKFPWGNDALDCNLANYENCKNQADDVKTHEKGASPFGAINMLGNVAEWVSDWYDPDFYGTPAAATDPQGSAKGDNKILKGGDWSSPDKNILRASFRHTEDPGNDRDDLGFRCARSSK